MRELGVDVVGYGWYGMYAPAKTPPEIVARLSKIVRDTVREPAMRERIQKIGLDPTGTTPDELAKIQRDDHDYWGPIIKASGFKPEQ
jgi:tripartite-type tricarboxylate transporter receptor subunit TctC